MAARFEVIYEIYNDLSIATLLILRCEPRVSLALRRAQDEGTQNASGILPLQIAQTA